MRVNPLLLGTFALTLAFGAWTLRQRDPDGRSALFFNQAEAAAPGEVRSYSSEAGDFSVQVAVDGLELPWDLVFLGDKEILITEKPGRLTRINLETGTRTLVQGTPQVALYGQGGLFAVALHPAFASNGLLYLSYAAKTQTRRYTTRLMRARLVGNELVDQKLLFSAAPELDARQHFGGALLFDQRGFLYLSVGDRGQRDQAQNLGSQLGKIFRFKDDGSVPDDNPFRNVPGALPEIYSYGHRNPQGMSLDPATGQIWAVEHGPQGGDELNRILPGRNYGWPVITYGQEYGGGWIGKTQREGMEQPVHWYVPSIATGGMAFYDSETFPGWKGSVFIAALKGEHLNRVQLRNGKFVSEERLLKGLLRVRSVKVSPSGELWVIGDNGVVLRVFIEPYLNG